jgi:hypothetical protein
MEKGTWNYGAIDFIEDTTNTHIVKDEYDKEFVVEVFPIKIDKEHIYKKLAQDDPNRWFIKYETKIIEPSKTEIRDAIESGDIIQLSQSLRVMDNYGLSYQLTFDKESKQYVNNNTNIGMKNNISLLPDRMIDYIQKYGAEPYYFPTSSRVLYSIIQEQLSSLEATNVMEIVKQMGAAIDKLTMTIDDLSYRIAKLEEGR